MGVATALMRCTGTEANGDKIEIDFRLTIAFAKSMGGGRSSHEAVASQHLSRTVV
jgi:ketosteroid isomerase-like protein